MPHPPYIRGSASAQLAFSLSSNHQQVLYLTVSHSLFRELTSFFIFEGIPHSFFKSTDIKFSIKMPSLKLALLALAASLVSAQINLSDIPTCAVSQLHGVNNDLPS